MGKFTPLDFNKYAALARQAAAEGCVLLKNENEALPLRKGDKVAVFGRIAFHYYKSGLGSGGLVNTKYVVGILDALKEEKDITLDENLLGTYEKWIEKNPYDEGQGWGKVPWSQKEMELTDEILESAKGADAAIVVVGRTAGEDQDNKNEAGSYLLTDTEKEMVEKVSKAFARTIVVLNVGNIIDMKWVKECNPAAVLYVWQGGQEGGNGVADVLMGRVNPCGKLTDTIAENIEDYPSQSCFGDLTRNEYKEDIYVGYRYFETFAKEKVLYPFGFGLSYTTFAVTAEAKEKDVDNVTVTATVENTGKTDGKEVVQVYVKAPQGVLGKPSRALVGFAKTGVLAPGAKETLTIDVTKESFASYDDSGVTGHKSCYVLEEGMYEIYVGNSVRCTEKADVDGKGGYEVSSCTVTEALEEALAPTKEFSRLKTGERRADGTFACAYEKTPQQTVNLAERIESRLPEELPQTGNKGITLQDVAEKIKNGSSVEEELNTFVAQFTNEELAVIVRGEGMSSPKVTPGTASAFGGVSDSLHGYGIPIACASDGPSGIRMESGLKATQLPIGTLLACSFNIPMMEELYQMEGKELVGNEIDTLLGPGINIHRYPLNGRNFEYFSEDPLVTGQFAAAMTRGIRKAGSSATVKHFAANNQETARHMVNSVVSERALREIYLKGFEIAVKEGNANSIMTSYNPVNGHWTASNYDLNTTILRGEWGYDGIVMTDWWAKMNDVVNGGEASLKYTSCMVRAQNDLYMVVNNNGAAINAAGDDTLEALEAGKLTVGELQRCAKNICRFLLGTPVMKRPLKDFDPLLSFTAKEAVNTEGKEFFVLQKGSRIEAEKFENVVLHVEEESIFNLNAHFCFPIEGLAQGTANLYLNGELMATVQTGGTGERFLTQRMCRVKFMRGYYELKAEYVTPELKLDWIELA